MADAQQQLTELDNLFDGVDALDALDRGPSRLETLLEAEQVTLVVVGRDGDDHPVEQPGRAHRHVPVTEGRRVEGAREDRDARFHARIVGTPRLPPDVHPFGAL